MDQTVFTLLFSGIFGVSSSLPLMYFYVNQNKTWLEAQSTCRGLYTDLATVYSMDDVKRLTQALPGSSDAVWIGLRKSWVWSSGEAVSNYSHWKPYNPNEGNAEASCAVLTTAGWQDWYCSNTYYFVCFDGNDYNLLLVTHFKPTFSCFPL
uniref:C-type lectin domain-containing protein n=1 Tax=Electrophorus electricus TaxID=8005 RepID=A0AAY5EZ02_ELEEL